MTRRRTSIIAFGILCLVLAMAALWYQSHQPRTFQLEVANRSTRVVEQVRLFGSGLEQDAVLLTLPPGATAILDTPLKARGALRFEVAQGGNRIDTYIVEDTRRLEHLSQRLTIHDDNRFLLDTVEAP